MRQRSLSVAALPRSTGILPPFSFASAHRFLVNSVLKRVTNTQAAILRRRTAQQLFTGHSGPFLALVGVSLASGTGKAGIDLTSSSLIEIRILTDVFSIGLITKEDEVECVCSEIRQAAAKMQTLAQKSEPTFGHQANSADPSGNLETSCLLKDFQIGPIVAKGCNAVVFAAQWAREKVAGLNEAMKSMGQTPLMMEPAKIIDSDKAVEKEDTTFPLAIKMMFNYEAESNAMAIISAMNR